MEHNENRHTEEIRRAIGGDQAAIDRLLLAHRDSLARYVGAEMPASIRSEYDVEDVLQEVFRDACVHIGSFKDTGDRAFRSWLRMIANHRVIDLTRRANARARRAAKGTASHSLDKKSVSIMLDEVEALARTPSQSMSRRLRLQILSEELSGLPDRQRTTVVLRMVQGLNWGAIGKHLGCSTDAAEKLYTRALKTVTQRFATCVSGSEKT